MKFAALSTIIVIGSSGCFDDVVSQNCLEAEAGPRMRPGENCLRCHVNDSNTGAPPWSAGGTVYSSPDSDRCGGISGAEILFFDDQGRELQRVQTNDAGNFYTSDPLPELFRVAVEYQGKRIDMPDNPPAGSCNACHSDPPLADAPGRIYVP